MMVLALALALSAEPAPPTRQVSQYKTERLAYTVTQIPGVGAAGHVIEFLVRMEELTTAPDPSYGKQRLVAGASVRAYLLSSHGEVVDARVASQDGDDGNFALHFTPLKDGLYTLHIVGESPAGVLPHSVLVPVHVWPIPAGAKPVAPPKKLPYPSVGDVAHGKLVCARDCQGVAEMSSEGSEALNDVALVERLAPSTKAVRLVDHDDLLAYLRSQFIRVRDFFPDAAGYVIEKRGFDSEAVARVKTLAGQTPAAYEGNVFVVYSGRWQPRIGPARHVDVHSEKIKGRLGYVVYDGELAIALSPKIAVLAARQRDANGIHLVAPDPAVVQRAIALVKNLLDEEHERADSVPAAQP